MPNEVVTALIGGAVGVLTTLLTVLYGPVWKSNLDRRRAQGDRSEQLLARYSEPLVRAAYDLQSRLYNLIRQSHNPELTAQSTLWLFGQYLAWVEILRREVQVLDLGDVVRTSRLQRHLFDITDVLASSSAANIQDDVFNIYRADQRAIGELMVVDRLINGSTRSDCLGYAEFVQRMSDPTFSRWFSPLDRSIKVLAKGAAGHNRPVHLQRALIDLIDFLDPDRVRFPDPNERGRIPLPADVNPIEYGKRTRPAGQVARFRYPEGDPWPVLTTWATINRLAAATDDTDSKYVELPVQPWRLRKWRLKMNWDGRWAEMILESQRGRHGWQPDGSRLPARPRRSLDELLRRFDRPLTYWPRRHILF